MISKDINTFLHIFVYKKVQKMRVAINGFGRVGRAVFKLCLERDIDVIAINDIHGVEDAAYLLKYDSVYRRYKKRVKIRGKTLEVNGNIIEVVNQKNSRKLP